MERKDDRMTRLRGRLAALAVTLAVPGAFVAALPTAGHAGEEETVISINGTICWESLPQSLQGTSVQEDNRPTVTVYLSAPSKEEVTVLLSTRDGTAVAPEDYLPIRDLVVYFRPGETKVLVPLDIRDDGIREPDEWFLVTIYKPSGGVIGTGTAQVIILDGSPPRQ